MNALWLEQTGLSWLRALEDERGFAESVSGGVAVRGAARTAVTQARLGYCWAHLAQLFPQRSEFAQAANKSFRLIQDESFAPVAADFQVYDHSFYLLFMAWYFRLTGDRAAVKLLNTGYSVIERHLDDAGAGGFGPHPAGIRSHNPYMHLLEAVLAAFRSTKDDYWLSSAREVVELFFTRLLDGDARVVFEFLNHDWTVAGEGRVEIGHQLEWPTLLLELHELTGQRRLLAAADDLYGFALRFGFEDGLVLDAVGAAGHAADRRKLLWSQLEAARHFSVRARRLGDNAAHARTAAQWESIRNRFFRVDGWTWYNRLSSESVPIEEPSMARLLYHVVTAGADAV